MLKLRHTLLALACAGAFAGSAQAIQITEAFDGNWSSNEPAAANKGLMVDYIPGVNVFFFAFFTYDEQGQQIWLVNNFTPENGVSEYTIDALRFTGGRFSSAGMPSSESLGSVTLSLSCDGIGIDFSPAGGSGLQAANFTVVPSLGLDALDGGQCVTALEQCPAGTTAAGDACQLPNAISTDLRLPAGKTYLVSGQVNVEAGASLTLEPGVVVHGADSQATPKAPPSCRSCSAGRPTSRVRGPAW